MKTFKEYADEAITEGTKGKIKGTEITYETGKAVKIKGPFGDEDSYTTVWKMDKEIVAKVTIADQGIIDCVVEDEMMLGALLNDLLSI